MWPWLRGFLFLTVCALSSVRKGRKGKEPAFGLPSLRRAMWRTWRLPREWNLAPDP